MCVCVSVRESGRRDRGNECVTKEGMRKQNVKGGGREGGWEGERQNMPKLADSLSPSQNTYALSPEYTQTCTDTNL